MKRVIYSGRASLVTLIAALALTACGQEQPQEQQSQQQEAPPHPVEVTEIARRDIPLDKSYPSLLRSDIEVTLVARVSGFLEERHFEPGQMVEEGDRLYTIEPDLYQATVNQREADLQSARAELARAQRDAQRFEQLLSQNSVSRQQYDQALAEQRVAQARVAQAEAALTSANLDLGYSNVTAPVSGMISLSQINVGNLVTSGTELATITPLDPLEVRFQLPQRDAFELRRQLADSAGGAVAEANKWLGRFVLVGWAIYPLGYMVGTGEGQWYEFLNGAMDMDVVYNIGDAINKIGFGLVIYALAVKDSNS